MPLRNIFCRLWPACWMKPKIFSEITGNTQGIKFNIIPPRNPKSRKVKMPRAAAGRAESSADDPVCTAADARAICHAARCSPFGCCANTTRPAIDDRFLGADSSGMRNTISLLFRD